MSADNDPRGPAELIAGSDVVQGVVERGFQVVVLVLRVDETDVGIIATPTRSPGFIGSMLESASRYLFAADNCMCAGCKRRRADEVEAEMVKVRH